MFKKSVLTALVLALVFSSLSFSLKEPRERKGRDFQQLNLTPEQEKQIESRRIEFKEKMIDLRSQIEKKELEREKLYLNDEVSREKLVNLSKEISEIKTKMEITRVNHSMDVYEMLDANQKAVWKEMQIKRERFKDGMKRHVIGKMELNCHRKMRN